MAVNKILSDTKVAVKIIVPLILLALVGLGGAAYSAWEMKRIDADYSRLVDVEGVALVKMVRVNRTVQGLGYDAYKIFAYDGASAEARDAADHAKEKIQTIETLLTEAESTAPHWKDEIESFRGPLNEIRTLVGRSVEFGLINDKAAERVLLTQLDAKMADLVPKLTAFTNAKVKLSAEESAQLSQNVNTAALKTLIAIALATVAALAAGLVVARSIVGALTGIGDRMGRLSGGDTTIDVPHAQRKDELGKMGIALIAFRDAAVEKMELEAEGAALRTQSDEERARNQRAADALAREQATVVAALGEGLEHLTRGDLTYSITQDFPGDYAKLKADFNTAIAQLQQAMGVVLGNVAGIRSGAGEISQAADDLSRRTEQQAASLEETAAALDEITATVNKTASGARQASDVVQSAKGDAETSGVIVRDAVEAMHAIEGSSAQINQIIGVIDEIAFQTNLLALNAGVEAARAGEAGRGFAVVASEVRALAQRSAEAAKEIKTLISASTTQVGSGVKLVGQTGEALQRIVDRVAEIDGLVSEIAASAQEQAVGLAQVNTAVNQMDQVTQQNAAMVEQSTAASHSLAQEAEALQTSVAQFKVGETARAAPALRSAPKPARPEPRPAASAPARSNHMAAAMKTIGRGGAAPAPQAAHQAAHQAAPASEGWEEF
ncbi:methyl-accepting chemotaxis protein [Brevundimonas intermedia]|nr:methyl-accepting chemotaxis protein [Brevundimonas intermedia]